MYILNKLPDLVSLNVEEKGYKKNCLVEFDAPIQDNISLKPFKFACGEHKHIISTEERCLAGGRGMHGMERNGKIVKKSDWTGRPLYREKEAVQDLTISSPSMQQMITRDKKDYPALPSKDKVQLNLTVSSQCMEQKMITRGWDNYHRNLNPKDKSEGQTPNQLEFEKGLHNEHEEGIHGNTPEINISTKIMSSIPSKTTSSTKMEHNYPTIYQNNDTSSTKDPEFEVNATSSSTSTVLESAFRIIHLLNRSGSSGTEATTYNTIGRKRIDLFANKCNVTPVKKRLDEAWFIKDLPTPCFMKKKAEVKKQAQSQSEIIYNEEITHTHFESKGHTKDLGRKNGRTIARRVIPLSQRKYISQGSLLFEPVQSPTQNKDLVSKMAKQLPKKWLEEKQNKEKEANETTINASSVGNFSKMSSSINSVDNDKSTMLQETSIIL
mmetsp:Transcript_37087/g.86509  ORF Transcript_37087/g.86509 Transcript_37087/m.86509 type:complete len:438 (-) Transcript_37087:88-1401(-)